MNKDNMLELMAVLEVAYPAFYRGESEQKKKQALDLWYEMFKNDSPELVIGAVKAYIATNKSGYPPNIGQIKDYIYNLTSEPETSEYEAWNTVKKAIKYYTADEEFKGLPPLLQKIVGTPGRLREWATMNTDELETVVGSNFMRSYRAKKAKDKEYQMLPEQIKQISQQFAERLSMDNEIKRLAKGDSE